MRRLAAEPANIWANLPPTLGDVPAWLVANAPAILNTLFWLAVAVATAIAVYFSLSYLRDRLVAALQKDQHPAVWRSVATSVVAHTWRVSFVVVAATIGAAIMGLSPSWWRAVIGATLIVQLGLWLGSFLREVVARYAERKTTDRSTLTNAMSLVQVFINIAVWSIVALVLLSNLGFDVTALVAGLGIGGIAIGLAAQSIFADLFASLSIILDRPFMRGDFVVFGDHMGTIERIGIKSTRIRSLSGEQIVVSNANLLKETIRNYQLLYERRAQFRLAVSYATPADKAAAIPGMLRDVVTARQKTRFDRAHFKEFGEQALIFEVVYVVLDPEYRAFMDVQQEINLEIMRAFAAEGIEFAALARTITIEQALARAPN